MEPLAAPLKRLLGRNGRLVPLAEDPDAIERMLLERPLLPTAAYAALLRAARTRLNSPETSPAERNMAGIEVGRLERDLELADTRDQLLAERPLGCFCYGLGGLRRRYLPMPEGEPISTWEVPCSCPEAVAQQATWERMLDQRRVRIQQARAERLFGSLPERFKGWSFESLLALSAAHAETVGLVREWLDDGRRWALILRGPVATAKTGVAIGGLDLAVRTQRSALYVDTADMLDELRSSFGSAEDLAESIDAHWESLFTVDVLLIDDVGAERHRSGEQVDWATEQLWRLIGNRHRNLRKTIVTTNHSLQELTRLFGHARISSRLAEESLVINTSDLPQLRRPGESPIV